MDWHGSLRRAVSSHETNATQDFQTALNAFGETMAASIAHHSQPASTYLATGARQAQWLFTAFGGYAHKVLSRADVAVMFLSRKILVDQVGLEAITPSLPAYQEGAGYHALQQWPPAYASSQLGAAQQPRSLRALLGAMLFLAAVEAGWQMHHRTVRLLPKNLQAAISPMQVSLPGTPDLPLLNVSASSCTCLVSDTSVASCCVNLLHQEQQIFPVISQVAHIMQALQLL